MLLWILFIGDVEDSNGRRTRDGGPLLVGMDHGSFEKTTMSDTVGWTRVILQRGLSQVGHGGVRRL